MKKFKTKFQAVIMAAAVTVGSVFGNWYTTVEAADTDQMVKVQIPVTYGQTEARSMLDAMNDFRQGDEAWVWDANDAEKVTYSNLGALSIDPALERIAMLRAVEIALIFSHTRPNGQGCFTAYSDNMAGSIAENIAAGYSSAEAVFRGWQETDKTYSGQGHRRNMLGSAYVSVGIGHVTYHGTDYWVQEFSSKRSGEVLADANDSTVVEELEVLAEKIQNIQGNKSAYSLTAGETVSLEDLKVSAEITGHWSYRSGGCPLENVPSLTVADSGIASVENGILSAKSAGTTTLTVAVLGKELQIPVTVAEAVVTPTETPNPSASTKPDVSESPSASSQPDVTGSPSASSQPDVSESPSASSQPDVSESPSASSQPDVSESPSASSQPDVSESPSVSSQPDVSESPSVSSQPDVTGSPSVSSQPDVTGSPSTSAKPDVTQNPYETNHPNPIITDNPYGSQVPDGGEISVQTNPLKGKKVTGIKVKQKKKSAKVTIRYKRMKKADGYQITYAWNKKFTKHRKVKNTKSASLVLSGLKHKKTYYFKVRAYILDKNGKKQYSANSKIIKRKIS